MAKPSNGALPVARGEPRTRTALMLESIALRHQIAVLKRSGTSRPCFRLRDRLFWILLAQWWPSWRDSLVIVQPANRLVLAPQQLVKAVGLSLSWSLAGRTAAH